MKLEVKRTLVTVVVLVLAVLASLALWSRYTTQPWTRDGQVRANIVGIAARVAGPIVQIPVKDNQAVKKGDLLFEIDPATYQAALDNATAELGEAQAALVQSEQELQRQTALYAQKVNDVQDLQNAQDLNASAKASVAAAKANVESATLDLSYTKVFAPVNGLLTNMNTSPGTYVQAGEELLALVDSDSFWVAAYFKETQLKHVAVGQAASITLMGHESSPFAGGVQSVGWGVYLEDGATIGDLLPSVSQTVNWVRLPQRFPVRVRIEGEPPVPLRIGLTASVAMR